MGAECSGEDERMHAKREQKVRIALATPLMLNDLPEDALLVVFECLSVKDQMSVSMVNKTWRSLCDIAEEFSLLIAKKIRLAVEVLVKHGKPSASSPEYKVLSSLPVPNARWSRFSRYIVGTFRVPSSPDFIDSSNLAFLTIPDSIVEDLENFPVGALDLSKYSWVNSGTIRLLEHIPKLRHLDLACCDQITDAAIDLLGSCVSLRTLILSQNLSLRKPRFSHLSQLTHLQISNCLNVKGYYFKGIGRLSQLISLNLSFCSLSVSSGQLASGSILEAFSELKKLRVLNVSHCRHSGINQGLKVLRSLPSLTSLDLSFNNSLTDAGLLHLTNCDHTLRTLRVNGCDSITDTGLISIGSLGQLEELQMSACGSIYALGLSALGGLARLKVFHAGELPNVPADKILELACTYLQLREISLTDMSLTGVDDGFDFDVDVEPAVEGKMRRIHLEWLGGLTNLERIDLSGNSHITDQDLEGISCADLPWMTQIDISFCNQLTLEGLSFLLGPGEPPPLQASKDRCVTVICKGLTRIDDSQSIRSLSLSLLENSINPWSDVSFVYQ